MQEELKRSNTIGDYNGILYFARTVLKNGVIKRESARHLCSFINGVQINYNSIVAFFEYLELVSVSTDTLTPTEDGSKLYALLDSGFEEMLCEVCLKKLLVNEIIDTSAFRFDASKRSYYIQKHGFPIASAVFRNVLIQFRALVERQDGTLELAQKYEKIFAKVRKAAKRKLSLVALKSQMELQEAQGEAAEVFVLEYEKTRLADMPNSAQIKRISDIDVSAGYDIVSFDSGEEAEYNRFIEVKSHLGQPHFYWSKNEIDTATLLGNKYYIYLVDVEKAKTSGYVPTIIRDPAKEILLTDNWILQSSSYLVLPTGEVLSNI